MLERVHGPISFPPLVAAALRAPVVGGRGEIRYLDLPCRNALNRCTSKHLPFRWTINPYRGCEFGCRYCYARYTHEFMGLEDSRLFETLIYAKRSAAQALERDLPADRPPSGPIAMGTVTDPYQPAERRLKVTRGLLEIFARRQGLSLSITTKGCLITRDIELLQSIARRNRLSMHVTITTLSRKLSRLLEPRAPRPGRRLETVRALTGAGIRTGIFIMPVIPGITDATSSLEALVAASARAGASSVAYQTLSLRGSTKKEFYPFLDASFPRLAPRLRRAYGANGDYSSGYRRQLRRFMEALLRKYGLSPRLDSWEEGGQEGRRQGKGPESEAAVRPSRGARREAGWIETEEGSQLPLGF
jgi:DNA repair photolyase